MILPTQPADLIATLVLGAVLAVIAAWDARTYRIPDFLSLPLVAAGLAAALAVSRYGVLHHLTGAAAGYGLLALVAAVYRRARGRDGLGLGDAKLFAASGAWLGWMGLPSVLMIASFAGLAHFAVRAVLGRGAAADARIAFGPYLAFATFAVWLIGPIMEPPVWR